MEEAISSDVCARETNIAKLYRRFFLTLLAAVISLLLGEALALAITSADSIPGASCDVTAANRFENAAGQTYDAKAAKRDDMMAFMRLVGCPSGTQNVRIYKNLVMTIGLDLEMQQYNMLTMREIATAKNVRSNIHPEHFSKTDAHTLIIYDSMLASDEKTMARVVNSGRLEIEQQPVIVRQYAAPNISGAPNCDDYTIDDVHREGAVITMLDGSVFLVSEVDQPTSAIWLTADDIKACTNDGRHFKLIDGNDDVYATKIR